MLSKELLRFDDGRRVQEHVGHKNLSVTLGYARGTKRAAAALDGALLGLRGIKREEPT